MVLEKRVINSGTFLFRDIHIQNLYLFKKSERGVLDEDK